METHNTTSSLHRRGSCQLPRDKWGPCSRLRRRHSPCRRLWCGLAQNTRHRTGSCPSLRPVRSRTVRQVVRQGFSRLAKPAELRTASESLLPGYSSPHLEPQNCLSALSRTGHCIGEGTRRRTLYRCLPAVDPSSLPSYSPECRDHTSRSHRRRRRLDQNGSISMTRIPVSKLLN